MGSIFILALIYFSYAVFIFTIKHTKIFFYSEYTFNGVVNIILLYYFIQLFWTDIPAKTVRDVDKQNKSNQHQANINSNVNINDNINNYQGTVIPLPLKSSKNTSAPLINSNEINIDHNSNIVAGDSWSTEAIDINQVLRSKKIKRRYKNTKYCNCEGILKRIWKILAYIAGETWTRFSIIIFASIVNYLIVIFAITTKRNVNYNKIEWLQIGLIILKLFSDILSPIAFYTYSQAKDSLYSIEMITKAQNNVENHVQGGENGM